MRYNFLHPVKFNIFMDMQVSAIRHLGKNDVEGGINPGASYALNNHFSILLKYLFIGFNGEDRKRDEKKNGLLATRHKDKKGKSRYYLYGSSASPPLLMVIQGISANGKLITANKIL